MLPMKNFKVISTLALHCLLIVNYTKGYGLPSMPMSPDSLSTSEVNKVLTDLSERTRLYNLLYQVPFEKPLVVPSCSKRQIYHAKEKVCAEPYDQKQCGKNMYFLPVPNNTDLGACFCDNYNPLSRWGRPQALTERNQCADIGTRGPCDAGEVITPITKFHAECGVDACTDSKPKNATNFSEGSKNDPSFYPVFNFTYKGTCFTTESKAFCSRGKAARFILPYKIPVCVDRKEFEYNRLLPQAPPLPGSTLQQSGNRECEPGTVADPFTGICREQAPSFDFA